MRNFRAKNRKLVRSHVMGCRARCFRGWQWLPRSFFYDGPQRTCRIFLFLFLCFFVVVVDRAIKSNYRVINEKLSRDKSNIITWQMINYCAINEKLTRQWLPQLRRYGLRSLVCFIFEKRSSSSTLQYFLDTQFYESIQETLILRI